ncbi:MAG TPA: type II toxin-antitoxin system RelE/ParE family toxin [Methanotrichaceae archaeon]|nr:type II toxin-antitoxin system RelE/ParE family toxin [Methanotrichaceae archaeon]
MFRLLYSPVAAKSLKKMSKETATRIVDSLDALSEVEDPKRYIKKLKGSFGIALYSFRVGDHRVILDVREDALIIYVIDIGDRSTIYRNF